MKLYFYHKILIIVVSLVLLIFILFATIVYPKLNYFEPVKLSIEVNEPGAVSMYAKTPFNRTIDIPFDTVTQTYHLDYSFLNSIYIKLPAHYLISGVKINLSIGENDYSYSSDNLKQSWALTQTTDKYQVLMLKKPEKQKSLINSFLSVFFWPLVRPFYLPGALLLLLVIIVILLFYFKDKIRKVCYSKTNKQKVLFLSIILYSIIVVTLSIREYILLKKGLEHINIISSICFYLLLFALLLTIFYLVFWLFRISSNLRNNVLLSLFTVFIVLLLAETTLRIFRLNANYFERTRGIYGLSNYDSRYAKPLLRRAANSTVHYITSEFEYYRKTNSLGFCDNEFQVKKNKNVTRLIVLGDSYSEGVGVTGDSCWISILRKALSFDSVKWEVFNAGVIGSDPVYQFYALENELLAYSPDIVIVPINNSDISDVIFRGGFERFQPDGSVRYKNAPCWEPVYAMSFIFRLIISNGLGYDYHLLSKKEQINAYINAQMLLQDVCQRFVTLADKHNIHIIFLFHPLMKEVKLNHYIVLNKLIDTMGKNATVVDVLPDFIETTKKDDINDYFWPGDQHYKVKGHRIVANEISKTIFTMRNTDNSSQQKKK
ncbi:MAG TPA: SGNH/GDSL hydrolase family protein [Bacteroidales bacterium]|nr:SGNH/GDSL hydrolase family protein [Bacteroidales bacterium]